MSGTIILQEIIYGKFDRLNNFNSNLFISFGDGIFNGTYLIFPSTSNYYLLEKSIIKFGKLF